VVVIEQADELLERRDGLLARLHAAGRWAERARNEECREDG
jgi:hypothetical protein